MNKTSVVDTSDAKSGGWAKSGEAATPPEIAEFMALIADPKVQKWLLDEQHAAEATEKPNPYAPPR